MSAIELAIFSSRIESICDEMGAMLQRAAFSPNIKDRLDFSCAIFDARGELVAQAAHIPVHLGSMAFAMKDVVGAFDWSDSDVVIFNNPYLGGTHLPDVTLVSPVIIDGCVTAFCACRAHHANIGASSPGSMPVSSHLDEEGVLISPMKLFSGGAVIGETLKLLLQIGQTEVSEEDLLLAAKALQWESPSKKVENVETPACAEDTSKTMAEAGLLIALGDFMAQLGAVNVGTQRLLANLRLTGRAVFSASVEKLNAYASAMTAAMLQSIPHGQAFFEDKMDGDGIEDSEVFLKVLVTKNADRILFDFSGTSLQVRGNINCPLSVTAAAVFYVIRCLLPPQLPACAGMFSCIDIRAEKGSLLNAVYPGAVAAGNVETSSRIVDVVLGALSRLMPKMIPAASQGTMNNVAMGGLSKARGRWDYYETICGGGGAHAKGPGLNARHTHMTNTLNTPIESLESHYPLRVLEYCMREKSGGCGKFSGGNGVIRTYQFLEDTTITLLTERRFSEPWGLAGAGNGTRGENLLNGKLLPSKFTSTVRRNDVLTIKTPGGGGYGEPIPE